MSFRAKCKVSHATIYTKLQGEEVSLNLFLISILVNLSILFLVVVVVFFFGGGVWGW